MHRARYGKGVLAAVSGVALALALPGFGLWPLAFVALVPLFWAQGTSRRLVPGMICGAVFFAIDLRWLLTLTRFTPLVVLGYAAVVVTLAVSFGLAGCVVGWARRRAGSAVALLAVAPAAFAALEILRAQGELGFGFSAAYLTLHRAPLLIQAASSFGPWALSAAIVFINGAVCLALTRRRALWGAAVALGTLALSAQLPMGPDGSVMQVAIVGSDVEQEMKLKGTELATLAPYYLDRGREAAGDDPDLVVFPESILPAFILRDRELLGAFAALARTEGVALMLGTGDIEDSKIYNRVVLFSQQGDVVGTYAMMHPVPFGETVPGRAFLDRLGLGGLIRGMLPLDLTPGTEFSQLDGIGTPICFESTFPSPSRGFAVRGAQLLVTVTNDAWFAGSSELISHFATAAFRAVETRRYVIQAANGGLSGVVDPRGRVLQSAVGETLLTERVARRDGVTAYARYGELPFLVLLLAVLLGAGTWRGAEAAIVPFLQAEADDEGGPSRRPPHVPAAVQRALTDAPQGRCCPRSA